MMAGLLLAAGLVLFLGFACLALAMPEHWAQACAESASGADAAKAAADRAYGAAADRAYSAAAAGQANGAAAADAAGAAAGPALDRRGLRPLGYALLALALVLCLLRDGPSFGSLLWVVMGCAAALAVALSLAWYPRLLLPLAWLWARAAGVRR